MAHFYWELPLVRDKSKGVRRLTPGECFRLQGFPKDYILACQKDKSLYKIAGDASSVKLLEVVFSSVYPFLL